MSAHASVVRKLARLLKNLEEQSSFLSKAEDERLWDQLEDDDEVGSQDEWKGTSRRLESEEASIIGSGTGQKVYALCEMILEDLNNYCECMIPIGVIILCCVMLYTIC